MVVAAVVLASSGSCLYTDPINMPPSVTINPPVVQVWRGAPVTFTAQASDPDGDAFTLEWTHTVATPDTPGEGRCPSSQSNQGSFANPGAWPNPALWPRQAALSYEVPATATDRPFCVWAFATDRHGAVAVAAPFQVDPSDHAPVAVIDLVEPVLTAAGLSLYAPIKFSAARSNDPDESDVLFPAWSLVRTPLGSLAPFGPCFDQPADPKLVCLSPDLPGDYEVQLTVMDGVSTGSTTPGSATIKKLVTVAGDQLPCLISTDPNYSAFSPSPALVRDPNDFGIFAVTKIDDDGDPFPGQLPLGVHFSWFIGGDTGAMDYLGNDQSFYTLPPGAFAVGDKVRLRVEIRDRKPDAVASKLATCADDADVCYGRPSCTQRVTWRIEYR